MIRIKLVSAVVAALLIGMLTLPWTVLMADTADRGGVSGLSQSKDAAVDEAIHAVDVDALELLENPTIRRSPLSIRSDAAVQAQGTAIALELDAQRLGRLRFEPQVQLDALPIPATRRGENARSVSLQLQQIPVITDETVFVLGSADAPHGIAGDINVPNMTIYRGTIAGEPESRVFLALSETATYGYIRSEGQTHVISPGPHGEERDLLIYNLTAMPAGAIPWHDFVCSAPQKFVDLTEVPQQQAATDEGDDPPCRRIELAIETDKEFTDDLFAGDEDAAALYVAALVGAMSEIYITNVNSYFEITFVRLWTEEDIWTGSNTSEQLFEFRDVWNAEMSDIDRHLAHYLSGRSLGGGVAWLDAICHSNNGYGLSANLNGFFPYPLQDNNSQNWDVMVLAHELGHNFGAPHTHNVCPPIDECAPSNWHGQCQDETNCISNGTIMSYCHTCSGGLTNVILEFHPVIRAIMLDFLEEVDAPSCALSTGQFACAIGGDGCEWYDLDGGVDATVWAQLEFEEDLIVGGDFIFTAGGDLVAPRIARWDGEAWNTFGGANSTVRTLAMHNGDLFAGGLFTAIGGQSAQRIARYSGGQWSSLPAGGVSGGTSPRVLTMKEHDGDLYVAGAFLNVGDEITANRIARWDGQQWHTLGTGMNDSVYALGVYDGDLIAGGAFTNAGGIPVNRIARWDGNQWHPLGTGVNDIVFALETFDEKLFAGGAFTTAGGGSASHIAAWDGDVWQPIEGGVDDVVLSLTVQHEQLYAAGSFSVAGSAVSSRVARWDGEAWDTVASGVNNLVRSVIPYGEQLTIGGNFTSVDGEPISRIARVECEVVDECPLFADLNCDGVVNVLDLLILLENWGDCDDPDDCPPDLNDDGVVNVLDLLILLENWG